MRNRDSRVDPCEASTMDDPGLYRVRTATQKDCQELARMRGALQTTMEGENPCVWPMAEARRSALPEFFAKCIDDPDVGVWVVDAAVGDQIETVATLTARIAKGRDVPRFGIVDDAWVDAAHRGQGLCRRLMAELIAFFRQREIVDLQLGFVEGGAAGAVWRHFGFTPTIVIANAKLDTIGAASQLG
ncbi:MAG: GNAT family N-acetyltransferase [Nannocystaceae bacterium]|nr:GNAT family N-acetyltransferase [Nannocystaceae bacterium]